MILTTFEILLVSMFTLYIYIFIDFNKEFKDIELILKKLKHDLKGIK